MPNINVEVSEELLKAIKIKCAEEMVAQKDWVPRVLKEAANGRTREKRVENGTPEVREGEEVFRDKARDEQGGQDKPKSELKAPRAQDSSDKGVTDRPLKPSEQLRAFRESQAKERVQGVEK